MGQNGDTNTLMTATMTKIDLAKLSKHRQELEEIFYLAVYIPQDIPVHIHQYIHLLDLRRFHRGDTYFLEIYPDGKLNLHRNGQKLDINNLDKIREIIEKLNG